MKKIAILIFSLFLSGSLLANNVETGVKDQSTNSIVLKRQNKWNSRNVETSMKSIEKTSSKVMEAGMCPKSGAKCATLKAKVLGIPINITMYKGSGSDGVEF